MMGHHGVKVELQDVDPGWLVVSLWVPMFFRCGEKKFGWCLGGQKGELEITCEKFRTV